MHPEERAARQVKAWRVVAALAPIPAIAMGLWLMRAHGVAAPVIGMQCAALAIGLLVFLGLSRMRWADTDRPAIVAVVVFLAALTATRASTGLEGVHRWISAGPVRLHISFLLGPAALAGMAVLVTRGHPLMAAMIAVFAQWIHLRQPDAGSAVAFGAGALAAFGAGNAFADTKRVRNRAAFIGVAIAVPLAAVAALGMRDPLLPVPHVEGILGLAASHGAWSSAAATLALMVAPIGVVTLAWNKGAPSAARAGAVAVAVHLAAAMIVTRFGAFPVPLLGQGASPVLGVYLGLGLIAAGLRSRTLAGFREGRDSSTPA